MILPWFVIVPLLAAFLIALVNARREVWAVGIAFLATAALLVMAVGAFVILDGSTLTYAMGGWPVPLGISLVLDSFSAFMLIMVSVVSLAAMLFSVEYTRHMDCDWRYYALFMLLTAGMNGVLITGDLFNLFVFMEVALVAAFALVAFGRHAEEFEAAFKYAVMGSLSSSLILLAIAVTYSATSTLSMARIAEALPQSDPVIRYWIGGLFLAGFGLKAAMMPFHAWLPDAHSSAPAPISAMLSGVLIKALGIYTLMRVFFNVLGAPDLFLRLFLVLGAVSIIAGVLLALAQWDFKRLLAYHSISQIGYILLGMGLATPLGIVGAVFHLFNHALFKGLLFLNAGAVEMAIGTRDLQKMGNLTGRLAVTSRTSMVASLSIAGIPPLNGFFSKVVIIIACVQAHEYLFGLLAVLGSVLTLASFMKVQRYGFRSERTVSQWLTLPDWRMNAAMIFLAVLCVAASLLIVPGIREAVLDPVATAVLNGTGYIQLVLGR